MPHPAGLEEGQAQELVRLIPEQHFTQPPPRYTEATLVRTLEEIRHRPSFHLCADPGDHPATRLRRSGKASA